MSLTLSQSTTTWDTTQVSSVLPPMVREAQASYIVHLKTQRDFVPVFVRGTASTDVQLSPGGTGDLLWDAIARTATWTIQNRPSLSPLTRTRQIEEKGPFGGRLISLAEACQLADQIALEAERRRQEARERDALYWSDLEDEA